MEGAGECENVGEMRGSKVAERIKTENGGGRGECVEGELVGSELLEKRGTAVSGVRKWQKVYKFTGRSDLFRDLYLKEN